mmetsp:Transcript_6188/g.9660  ORF Transcript_6188/g.9660 Transcript_6188/m.9660 type:complete len:142 (-) Transcript_6188:311-736(-)
MLAKLPDRKRFNILAFPVNDFGHQAPGSSECERSYMYQKMGLSYGTFPIFDKLTAKGNHPSAVYQFLTGKTEPDVSWNYEVFLVGASGKVEKRLRTKDCTGAHSFSKLENAIDVLAASSAASVLRSTVACLVVCWKIALML